MVSKKSMEIVSFLEKDDALKKHLYRHTWTSGSQTPVYPIQINETYAHISPRIVLQWDIPDKRTVRGLERRIKRAFCDCEVIFCHNDGSCPAEVIIEYKR